MIEKASQMYTLFPGDVLLTGTPEGVGEVRAGDKMSAWCEAIGKMSVGVK
jgi:2-keto-4-pentenoate hydratase/2-oxohepta-3-ene-1,7-dioic acid hydratase in catechol pathway